MSAPDPDAPRSLFARAIHVWDRIERLLIGLLGAFALVIAVIQVAGRYLDPSEAITWAEEVIVYIAVWAVMLAASELVHRDGHVRPDLVLRLLQPRAQRWVEMFNCLVAIAFTFGMVWYGWQVVSTALLLDQRSSTDLQFPMWEYYMALPTGGALMLIRYVIRLVRYAFFFDARTMSVGQHIAAHDALPEPALPFTE